MHVPSAHVPFTFHSDFQLAVARCHVLIQGREKYIWSYSEQHILLTTIMCIKTLTVHTPQISFPQGLRIIDH